jgi:hypothetical protein
MQFDEFVCNICGHRESDTLCLLVDDQEYVSCPRCGVGVLRHIPDDLSAEVQRLSVGELEATAMDQELANLRDELRAAKETEAKLRDEIAVIYSSTTWRATALVRGYLATRPRMTRYARRAAKVLWRGASGQLCSKSRESRSSPRQLIASLGPAAWVESSALEPWSEALPMVSVILSEPFPEAMRDALLTALTRTVPRYELLVIAPGSDQLSAFGHPNLRCYVRPPGVGDDANGDFAIKRAFGRYVCFLKPADRLSDDHLSRAIEQLERSGAEYAICRSSSPLVAPESNEFTLPPIFRRSTLERLSAVSSFGCHDTRRLSFASALAVTEFS